jgi:hypothetical protein
MYYSLYDHYKLGPSHAALVTLLFRMTMEIEALRAALSSPETPEAVREAYRHAYAETAVTSYSCAGGSGGAEKILATFFPWDASDGRFAEGMMMERLGATQDELRELADDMGSAMTQT